MKAISILDDFVHDNGISMKVVRVHSNPILALDVSLSGVEHYRCQLLKPGKQVDVYLSVEPSQDLLTVSDVLLMLAMEASGCRLLEGYDEQKEEWAAVFGGSDGNMEEIENFWQEFAGRCKQVEELRNFLGDAAYEKILRHLDIGEQIEALHHEQYADSGL